MRIKRKLIAAMMTGLAVMLSAALLGGTLTVATSAAKSASTAKAKHKKPKKHHKIKCPTGTHKKKGTKNVCVKEETKTETIEELKTEHVKVNQTQTITVTVTGVSVPEAELKKTLVEEVALVHPGLWPTESKEKGGTKAIESGTEIPIAPKFSNEELEAYAGGNWITSMGGNNGDHYSDLSEITPSSVSGLKSVWVTQLDGSASQPGIENIEPTTGACPAGTNPSLPTLPTPTATTCLTGATGYGNEAPAGEYNGVIYYATGAGDVFAVSVKSGKILWVHRGEFVAAAIQVHAYRDSRGVAFGNGLIYVGLVNSAVEALEMQTGHLKWYAEIGFETEGNYSVTSAPLYYNGNIYIGPEGADLGSTTSGARGFMEALNAESGAVKWKKYNVPAPGEYGHETWPEHIPCAFNSCNYAWGTGGATVQNAPVVDPETGDIIYGTQTSSSEFGGEYFGQERTGADLWGDSILARHPLTGEIAWGFQTTHHDIWNYDIATPAELINTEIGGKKVTDIADASKSGFGYDLEATSGMPQTGGGGLGVEEKAVPQGQVQQTFPTQPIPKMAPVNRQTFTGTPCPGATVYSACTIPAEGAHEPEASKNKLGELEEAQRTMNTFTTKTGGPAHVENGGYPCSTNVCATGHDVFAVWGNFPEAEVVANQGASPGRQQTSAYNPKLNMWYTCSQTNLSVRDITTSNVTEETFQEPVSKVYGSISAYNMQTGEQAWSKEIPHACYSGFLATGELLFMTSGTGQFIAYNGKTGAVAWEFGKEENLGTGCAHGAAKKKGLDAAFPNIEVPVSINKKSEEVWCHDEASTTEGATPSPEIITRENFNFGGNTGLGAGGAAPAIAFEFEGKEYIAVYAGGGTEAGQTLGDYLWLFSLGGSGSATPIKTGEGPLPAEELCSNYTTLRAESKNCEGY